MSIFQTRPCTQELATQFTAALRELSRTVGTAECREPSAFPSKLDIDARKRNKVTSPQESHKGPGDKLVAGWKALKQTLRISLRACLNNK
jgi:hypothetical protein